MPTYRVWYVETIEQHYCKDFDTDSPQRALDLAETDTEDGADPANGWSLSTLRGQVVSTEVYIDLPEGGQSEPKSE